MKNEKPIDVFMNQCVNCTAKRIEFNPSKLIPGISASSFYCNEPCDYARKVNMILITNDQRRAFEDETHE